MDKKQAFEKKIQKRYKFFNSFNYTMKIGNISAGQIKPF